MAKKTIKKVGRPYLKKPTKAQKITTHKYTKTERIPYSPFRLTKEMREAIKLGDIDKLMGLLMNSKSIENIINNLATDGDVERLKKILFERGDSVSIEDYLKQIVYAYRSKVEQKAESVPQRAHKKDYTKEEKRILRQLQGVWDWMLQEIFDKLPNETKENIKAQFGTEIGDFKLEHEMVKPFRGERELHAGVSSSRYVNDLEIWNEPRYSWNIQTIQIEN